MDLSLRYAHHLVVLCGTKGEPQQGPAGVQRWTAQGHKFTFAPLDRRVRSLLRYRYVGQGPVRGLTVPARVIPKS